LKRWGILEKIVESGCPPLERQVLDVGLFTISGTPPPVDGVSAGYAPRRKVLDQILLEAAIDAGVEVREHFSVEGLLTNSAGVSGIRGRSSGGAPVKEHARFVIGADGMHSVIARMVDAPAYLRQPSFNCAYYTYWSDVSVRNVELYIRPGRAFIAAPTNDRLTLTIVYWPESEFQRVRTDIGREFLRTLDLAPDLGERVRSGIRTEKFRGSVDLVGFFRRPYGSGWALVGDAGYHKNPITATGITDAFRDAELLAGAIDDALAGRLPAEVALAQYERQRNDTALAMYQVTCDMAKLEPPTPQMQSLFASLRGQEEETGRFLGTLAGSVPATEFFSPENLDRVTGQSQN
jgi:flavin-dependent dehydrogenase